MKKSLYLLIPFILMLTAAGGLAEKPKKVPPSKTTGVKEKLKETDKQEEPKSTAIAPAQVSPEQDQSPAVMKPAAPSQIQVLPAPTAPLAGEEINWQVISQGGTDGGSASYQLGGTVSQTAIGFGTSASYNVQSGFWQEFGALFLCGDVNEDGIVNIGDIVYLVSYCYRSGPPPLPQTCCGDANNDDIVNIGDIVYLVSYCYRSGPAPDPDCCNPAWTDA